ncbi:hypothetical protein V5799_027299 [Amblyomma americanum]|uniref:Secreted protein n=1 Tax=Amblyomma americanum TaxID=6943 RepID=A0AAQ4DG43_AMBAM
MVLQLRLLLQHALFLQLTLAQSCTASICSLNCVCYYSGGGALTISLSGRALQLPRERKLRRQLAVPKCLRSRLMLLKLWLLLLHMLLELMFAQRLLHPSLLWCIFDLTRLLMCPCQRHLFLIFRMHHHFLKRKCMLMLLQVSVYLRLLVALQQLH